jgi:prephenate dehydratase
MPFADHGPCQEIWVSVAYQGAPGAFGHQACLTFLSGHAVIPRPNFAGVADAVARGEAEYGMLPLSNSRAGEVEGVRQLIEGAGLAIEAKYRLPVRLHLLGLPGSRLDQVRTVASHPMALKQCRQSLSRLGVAVREAPNTALAAQSLDGRATAALASEAAAEIYRLGILMRDLQDDPDNSTLFALVRRD